MGRSAGAVSITSRRFALTIVPFASVPRIVCCVTYCGNNDRSKTRLCASCKTSTSSSLGPRAVAQGAQFPRSFSVFELHSHLCCRLPSFRWYEALELFEETRLFKGRFLHRYLLGKPRSKMSYLSVSSTLIKH